MNGDVRRVALAVAWIAIIAVISLGAAGIFGAMAHLPGTPSRAELTYDGDAAIEPGLQAAEDDLVALASDVRRLSELGRGALGALVSGDVDTLETSVTAGRSLSAKIAAETTELRDRLESLPGIGPGDELLLSPDTKRRHAITLNATTATDGLDDAWSRLATGSIAATRITVLLEDHDKVTGEAAAFGADAAYAKALAKLDQSDAIIAESRRLRDQLARTVDVTTLTQWLDLNAEYDVALRRLYVAVVASKGKVTQEVRDAFAAQKEASDRLPRDTKALTIILAQIAQGGLNEAVIGIEQARGNLDSAVDLLTASPEPEPAGASESP